MHTLLHQAEQIEDSGDPWGAELAEQLREDGLELGAQALEQIELEKQAAKDAEEFVIGRLMAVSSGATDSKDKGIFLLASSKRTTDMGEFGMNRVQIDELRFKIYKLLGVEPPSEEEFQISSGDFLDKVTGTQYHGNVIKTPSPATGLALVEQRRYDKVGRIGNRDFEEQYMGLYVTKLEPVSTHENQADSATA